MRGAERIVHVDVAQRRHLAGEALVVLFLALVAAAIFQQDDCAGFERVEPGSAVDPMGDQRDVAAEQFRQALRDRRERVARFQLAFARPAEVRCHHDLRAGARGKLERGKRGADPGVVGDPARIVVRHIQVRADEDPLAFELARGREIGEAEKGHVNSLPESVCGSGVLARRGSFFTTRHTDTEKMPFVLSVSLCLFVTIWSSIAARTPLPEGALLGVYQRHGSIEHPVRKTPFIVVPG